MSGQGPVKSSILKSGPAGPNASSGRPVRHRPRGELCEVCLWGQGKGLWEGEGGMWGKACLEMDECPPSLL